MNFVLLTGEYPPYAGGVADYTWQVVKGLRQRRHEVHVVAFREPRGGVDSRAQFVGSAVFPQSYSRAESVIRSSGPDSIVLVQYVPQMYGMRAMNLPFVLWLSRLKHRPVWVMFHEVHVTASQHSLFRHRVQAFVTQVMARRVAEKADRCFVSVQPFIDVVDKLKRASVPVEWLPIPSNLPSSVDQKRVDCLRADLVGDRVTPLVGHFGTFGGPLRHLLLDVIERAARVYPHWRFVFIGRGSREFQRDLEIRGVLPPGRSASSGGLAAEEAAHWISACDVMVQPYPDGVSTKRGSLMASLALGMPTVSNLGSLSDSLWQDCSGLMLADKAEAGEIVEAVAAILSDVQLRSYLQAEAAKLYARCFSSEHTICRLEAASVPATVA